MNINTVSTAGTIAADLPCRLHSLKPSTGDRCGRPVRFVVDVWDLDEVRHHVRQYGVCAEHADLYR